MDLTRRRDRASPEGRRDTRPLLLIARDRQRQVVAHCCERAHEAGVCPGMPAAQARALFDADAVRLEPADAAGDARSLQRLGVWAQRFSPMVQPDPPDGLLLDVSGCARAFGGERNLAERAARSLSRLGIRCRVVIAPTLAAAWALSRYGEQDIGVITSQPLNELLSPLPIAALGADGAAIRSLAEIGIERIGHVLELPRSCLPARFGPDLLHRLDRALGRAFEGIEPLRPTAPIEVVRAFDGPTDRPEAIALTVRELLGEVADQLHDRGRGARVIEIVLDRSDMPPESVEIRLSRPSRDAKHLERLALPRLERVHLGFGVEAIAVHVRADAAIVHEQSVHGEGFEVDGRGGAAVGEMIDAMTNRLGASGVVVPRLGASRRPERAAELVAAADADSTAPMPVPMIDADRPTVLFDRPERAEVIVLSPDGPVRSVRWRGRDHAIAACVGPERIGDEWWIGPGATRDYFRVRTEGGRWLWLARALEANRWFVHGVWA